MFSYTFRNLPESHIEGRFTTGGRVEYYFISFGSISVLVIEVKHKIMANRLNAIAQVIAECDGQSLDINFWYWYSSNLKFVAGQTHVALRLWCLSLEYSAMEQSLNFSNSKRMAIPIPFPEAAFLVTHELFV